MEYTAGTVLPVNIEDEMKRSYINYAMSVIASRALPDVRDGLKPVHRRILYTMLETGVTHIPDKPYRKAARVVGDLCWGAYHPPRKCRRFMMRWCGWHRISLRAIRWWMVTATSVPLTVTEPRPCSYTEVRAHKTGHRAIDRHSDKGR